VLKIRLIHLLLTPRRSRNCYTHRSSAPQGGSLGVF